MESYIDQFDYSVAIYGVSLSSLSLTLKSIGVGASVLSICRKFLSNRRQRVIVDCVTSERIPIVSSVPQGSVLGSLLFMLYTSEMFELVENRLYAYAEDFTLLILFAGLPTDQLLLPPLKGTWLGFRSGVITGA